MRRTKLHGVQNKKLNKVEDLGSAHRFIIGRLGGKIEGNIDRVIVLSDSEKEFSVKIYYTGFVNGFFAISTMGSSLRILSVLLILMSILKYGMQ